MNPFEEIIRSLGEVLNLPLKVDANHACCLRIEENFLVQIDLTKQGDRILVGSNLGSLRAGSYRNEILYQAFRMNGMVERPRGILSYSDRTNALFLFQYFPLAYMDGAKLANFLEYFIPHARLWYEAISQEKSPELDLEAFAR